MYSFKVNLMSSELSSEGKPQFLGSLASLLSLLGILLFFSGWSYRWAYFAYFSLDINEQTFSAQSFIILPFHILSNNLLASTLAVVTFAVLIAVTLRLLEILRIVSTNWQYRNKWIQLLYSRFRLSDTNMYGPQQVLASLTDEAVVVIWALIIVFLLSRQQGLTDARRDAVEQTSRLPVVSLILPQSDNVLAQDLLLLEDNGQAITDLPLANHALIGDLELAREIRSTSLSNDKKRQVWRLLAQEPEGWLYLIRTMPETPTRTDRPLVLAIPNAKQGQSLILSPESTQHN